MPTCCAKDCTNRLGSGFRFFSLPRNIERRKVWIEKSGCKATQYSKICEYHFDDDAFEKNRADGRRKLKPNAVPTIFLTMQKTGIGQEIKPEIVHEQEQLSVDSGNEQNDIRDFEECETQDIPNIFDEQPNEKSDVADSQQHRTYLNAIYVPENTEKVFVVDETGMVRFLDDGNTREINEIKRLSNEMQRQSIEIKKQADKINELRNGLNYYRETNAKLSRVNKNLRARLKMSMRQNNLLEKVPFLKKFVRGIENMSGKWSPECLKIATQIRCAVGWKVYSQLQKELKLPLPSYSTLCRHNENKFDSSPEKINELIEL